MPPALLVSGGTAYLLTPVLAAAMATLPGVVDPLTEEAEAGRMVAAALPGLAEAAAAAVARVSPLLLASDLLAPHLLRA